MNWFNFQELIIFFRFHLNDFEKASIVCNQVLLHKRFKNLPDHYIERFRIIEAYLYYFKEEGMLSSEFLPTKKKFKLGKFLNEVPKYSKDKSGANVQILIIQALFLIQREDIDESINRIDSLRQYCHKYLRKDHTFRSNCFIKMLVILLKNQFHKEAVERKTKKYLKLLNDHPIEKMRQSIGVEIVPFEFLWGILTKDLKNEFRFTPARKKRVDLLFPRV